MLTVLRCLLDILPPGKVILQWILFHQTRQQDGESVHQYVADLRGLARLCKFGTLQDALIGDQLAERTNNPRVQELESEKPGSQSGGICICMSDYTLYRWTMRPSRPCLGSWVRGTGH